jgi:large subunit ribosomal protein L9
MKVILLQNVQKVGKKGEVVEVSDGFATNALFPNKKAILATEKNLATLNRKIASDKASKELEQGLLESAIKSLPEMTLFIKVKANEVGHLFSKIDTKDIVEALEKQRIILSQKNIVLKSSIKELGVYTSTIQEGSYKKDITIKVEKE